MFDEYIELVNKEPDIELFGKKLIIVDPVWQTSSSSSILSS